MEIFLNILFLVLGMVLLIKGADFFVEGASAVAKKLKVPSIIIGLTIVALGTSLPELSVSVTSAISNSTDLSIGNVVGSNLSNMCLILGFVLVLCPLALRSQIKKFDVPFLLGITMVCLMFCADAFLDGAGINILSRTESIILFAVFVVYTTLLIINARNERKNTLVQEEMANGVTLSDATIANCDVESGTKKKQKKDLKVWQVVVYVIVGLGAVVFGGECVSTTSKFLALKIGMSEALVGLTVVAAGTSLPEFVTSIVAARKNEVELALGNVIGSNIANIALILGIAGTVRPMQISLSILVDLLILTAITIIFSIICFTSKKLGRREGIILICMGVLYFAFAICRNYLFPF